jgi:hypothetical protein
MYREPQVLYDSEVHGERAATSHVARSWFQWKSHASNRNRCSPTPTLAVLHSSNHSGIHVIITGTLFLGRVVLDFSKGDAS